MGKEALKADAQAMNAIATAMGALTFALIRALPSDKREAFAADLAAMAQARNDAGDTTSEMLLMDLHRAAVAAAETA
jgi:hypothetical protein